MAFLDSYVLESDDWMEPDWNESEQHPMKELAQQEKQKSTKELEVFYISGIVGVKHLVSKDARIPNKQIILCSDVHIDTRKTACKKPGRMFAGGPCIDKSCIYYFPVVLENLIKESPGMVDLYIEQEIEVSATAMRIESGKLKRSLDIQETLANTILHFKKCLSVDKRECKRKFPNLRYHYADYRNDKREDEKHNAFSHILLGSLYPLTNVLLAAYDTIENKKLSISLDTFKEDLKEKMASAVKPIQVYVTQIPQNVPELRAYYRNLISNRRIQSQLKLVKVPGFETMVRDFVDEFASGAKPYPKAIELLNSSTQSFLSPTFLDDVHTTQELQTKLESFATDTRFIIDNMLLVSSRIMDVYILTRAFKKLGGNEDQDRVVIYGGANHIKFINFFLMRHFQFEVKQEKTNDPDAENPDFCLQMDKKVSFSTDK